MAYVDILTNCFPSERNHNGDILDNLINLFAAFCLFTWKADLHTYIYICACVYVYI